MDGIELQVLGFDWDDGNRDHCQKHGVSVEAIEQLFRHEFFMSKDVKHSRMEDRMIAIGVPPAEERPLFIAFTLRKKDGEVLRLVGK